MYCCPHEAFDQEGHLETIYPPVAVEPFCPDFVPPASCQRGNERPATKVQPKKSWEVRRSYFGINGQFPRPVEGENLPWDPQHLIDGRADTGWFSRGHRLADTSTGLSAGVEPAWACVELPEIHTVSHVVLTPLANPKAREFLGFPGGDGNRTGFPRDFELQGSLDGQGWQTLVQCRDYPEPTPGVDQFFAFRPTPARFVRLLATCLRGLPGLIFYANPPNSFHLSIAQFKVLGEGGNDMALASRGGKVTVSSINVVEFGDPVTLQRLWPLYFDLGVKWMRLGQWGDRTEWSYVEQEQGHYHVDPMMDEAITEAVEKGIQVIITLCYGNNLYQPRPGFDPGEMMWSYGHPHNTVAPTTPEAVRAFGDYCAFMVGHFRDRVKHWEVWNEENIGFWQLTPNPDHYAALLKEASRRIKENDPGARVMFGGLAEIDYRFLRRCYELGAGDWVDDFAFHPYRMDRQPEVPVRNYAGSLIYDELFTCYEDEVAYARRLIGYDRRPVCLWANEIGWLTGSPSRAGLDFWPDVTELTQAKYLARTYVLNAALGIYTLWWNLYKDSPLWDWGLLRGGKPEPRPAYYVLRNLCAMLEAVEAAPEVQARVVPDTHVNSALDLRCLPLRGDDGATYVALWVTREAADDFTGFEADLWVDGLCPAQVDGLDTLRGTAQPLDWKAEGNGVTLRGLVVQDYPLLVRLR